MDHVKSFPKYKYVLCIVFMLQNDCSIFDYFWIVNERNKCIAHLELYSIATMIRKCKYTN